MFEHAERTAGHDQRTPGIESTPAVQRESPPAPDAPAATAPAATTVASTAAVAPAVGSANMDELATRLYEPLVARLKAELWLDRERAGALTDPRR